MAQSRLKIWESLFQRALMLIDSVSAAGVTLNDWSFGGGTVLMRRHHHRVSKDIDLFIPDPHVETSAEIVAKKVWHRGVGFTARDIFDLAMVVEKEPRALQGIRPILQDRRSVVLERIASQNAALREAFAALEVLDYRRSFEECVEIVKKALG